MEEYGNLGQEYVRQFENKWLGGGGHTDESLVGSPDIQSLADLRSSVMVIADMRTVPFSSKDVLGLAITTLLPVAPLLLTTFSVEQLAERMLKIIF